MGIMCIPLYLNLLGMQRFQHGLVKTNQREVMKIVLVLPAVWSCGLEVYRSARVHPNLAHKKTKNIFVQWLHKKFLRYYAKKF